MEGQGQPRHRGQREGGVHARVVTADAHDLAAIGADGGHDEWLMGKGKGKGYEEYEKSDSGAVGGEEVIAGNPKWNGGGSGSPGWGKLGCPPVMRRSRLYL